MRKLIFILLLLPAGALSQDIMPVSGTDFPEAIVSAPVTYNPESLTGYNNDGDLFIEFGFISLMVQEISWTNAKIKVEVYLMGSPEAAFGVYSLSFAGCLMRDTICSYDCNNIYQYQAASGNLYISITGESGSGADRDHYLPVAKSVMQRNPQQTFELPDPFNFPGMKSPEKSLVYLQGPIGLLNSPYPWQEIFLTFRFGMYAIYQPGQTDGTYFARILFESPAEMRRFLGLAGLMPEGVPVSSTSNSEGIYRAFQQLDDLTIYFLQSQEPCPIDVFTAPGK
jgi:hypothetical protein